MKPRLVDYAWGNVMSDVDREGVNVRDSLGAVLAMTVGEGVQPAVGLLTFRTCRTRAKGK